MNISIVICTCDRVESLRVTLEAVGRADTPPESCCELLLVDNGSGEEAAALLGGCRLSNAMRFRYLRERRRGKSYALNTALAEASGDILVFIDDDVRPGQDWLVKICAPILAGKADAVAGGIRLAPHLDKPWMSSQQRAWLAATDALAAADPSRMVGANMAFSRAVLDKVPAFDPELGGGRLCQGEDTLFSIQVREAGYRITGVFDAAVEHCFDEKRIERRDWINAAKRMGRTDAYLAHHWEHSRWTWPWCRALSSYIRLVQYRLFHFRELEKAKQTPDGLLTAIRTLHARLHYLRESRRPRNYLKRGLVKLPAA